LFVAVLGTFLIVAGLVAVMYRYTRPAPLGQERAAERKKALTELKSADTEALEKYGWANQAKGIVRLPISNAMELIVKEYANPAVAKSNLVAAMEKATALPPPPPNPFE
jgi:hypothetical protein